jgi:hypothetical protein
VNDAALEIFLARLYAEPALREAFARDALAACAGSNLTADEVQALLRMDGNGIELAAWSFACKRASRKRASRRWFGRVRGDGQ